MLIIHSNSLPESAIYELQKHGECIPFISKDTTAPPIAGHPDIFLCPIDSDIIIAPNTPHYFIQILQQKGLNIIYGEKHVDFSIKHTTAYNIAFNKNFAIHNSNYTDPVVKRRLQDREFIHINQGFSRCSLLPLKENHFITSDHGIARTLKHYEFSVCTVRDSSILLPGYKNGFIGGCMGVFEEKVFIIGKLDLYEDGKKIQEYLYKLGYEIIELYEGPLFDGGSLFLFSVPHF